MNNTVTMTNQQIADAQDAYHYAAVIAGKDYSAFEGERGTDPNCIWESNPFAVARDTYHAMLRDCAKAGISLVHISLRKRSMADIKATAGKVFSHIVAHCNAAGVDAGEGVRR